MNISERKHITIPVQKGILKGKKIPLPPSLKGHRNVTSSLIKEAVFQLIDNFYGVQFNGIKRYPVAFFDLCAGSGQMGVEALSRGFNPVHIVEKDRQRFEFILQNLKNFKNKNSTLIFHQKDFRRFYDDILNTQHAAIFIDLPYSFWNENGACPHLDHFFYKFVEYYVSMKNHTSKDYVGKYIILIQSPLVYNFPQHLIQSIPDIEIQIKHYRKHYLNVLRINLT